MSDPDTPATPAERWLSELSAAQIATLLDVDRNWVLYDPPVGPPYPSYYWHKRIFRSSRPPTGKRRKFNSVIVTKSANVLMRMDLIDVEDLDRCTFAKLTERGEKVVALLKARQTPQTDNSATPQESA